MNKLVINTHKIFLAHKIILTLNKIIQVMIV